MNGLTISQRVLGLVGLMAVGMIVLTAAGLWTLHGEIMREKHEETRRLVEVAHSLVADLHGQAEAGLLTEEEARSRALARLKGLRYDGVQYFWVNHIDGTMLMHPTVPDLEDTSLLELRDARGERPFADMIDIVIEQGGRELQLSLATHRGLAAEDFLHRGLRPLGLGHRQRCLCQRCSGGVPKRCRQPCPDRASHNGDHGHRFPHGGTRYRAPVAGDDGGDAAARRWRA